MAILLPSGPPPVTVAAQPLMPELRLLQAVLDDARACYQRQAGNQDDWLEAARWFASHDEDIGTFEWLCGHLRLDADAVRARFQRERRHPGRRLRLCSHHVRPTRSMGRRVA